MAKWEETELTDNLFEILEVTPPGALLDQILNKNLSDAHPVKLELLRSFQLFLKEDKIDIQLTLEKNTLLFLPKLYKSSIIARGYRREKVVDFVDGCLKQYRYFSNSKSISKDEERLELLTGLLIKPTPDTLFTLVKHFGPEKIDQLIKKRKLAFEPAEKELLSVLSAKTSGLVPELRHLSSLPEAVKKLSPLNRIHFLEIWNESIAPTHIPQSTPEGLEEWLKAEALQVNEKQKSLLLRAFQNLKAKSLDPNMGGTFSIVTQQLTIDWLRAALILQQVPFIKKDESIYFGFNLFPSEILAWKRLREISRVSSWNLYRETDYGNIRILILPTRPEFQQAKFLAEVFRCRFFDAMSLTRAISERDQTRIQAGLFQLLKGVNQSRLRKFLDKVVFEIEKHSSKDEISLEEEPRHLRSKEPLMKDLRDFDNELTRPDEFLARSIAIDKLGNIDIRVKPGVTLSTKNLSLFHDLLRIRLANSEMELITKEAVAIAVASEMQLPNFTIPIKSSVGVWSKKFLGETDEEIRATLNRMEQTFVRQSEDPLVPSIRLTDGCLFWQKDE